MWTEILFGIATLSIVLIAATTLFHQRWMHRLPTLERLRVGGADPPVSPAVHCSVVIPARDEEDRIEATVRRLLDQRGVALDVVVVDDRSTDRTGEILARLALAEPRLAIVRVNLLPDGWLGKCHACHLGAATATGEWILFTDADCWLKPDVIERALGVAAREAADHVSLTPGVKPETLAAAAWHLAFLATLADYISGANRDTAAGYAGMGAFNLVRASAYHACGGYERLRLTVLDDMRLGLLLRRAGKRTRAFMGGDDAVCQWGATARSMFHLMEKNYFAAVNYRTTVAVAIALLAPALVATVLVGLLSGTIGGTCAGLAPLLLIIPAAVFARRLGWPLRSAVLVPLAFPFVILAFLRSTFVTLRQGGIRWRDTFYPLDLLRKEQVK